MTAVGDRAIVGGASITTSNHRFKDNEPNLSQPVPGIDADFNWVVPGLAVGGQPSRQQTYRLHKLGIGAILSMRSEDDPEDNSAWAQRCGLQYQRVTVADGVPISQEALEEIAELVGRWRRDGLSVLIHCQAGRRRGPIGVAAVLISEGWTPEEALERVWKTRKQFAPTPDQMRSLWRYARNESPGRWLIGLMQRLRTWSTRATE